MDQSSRLLIVMLGILFLMHIGIKGLHDWKSAMNVWCRGVYGTNPPRAAARGILTNPTHL